MHRTRMLLLALGFATPSVSLAADTPTTSKIVAVDLFKNGLAVVRREATLGKAGTYVFDDVPDAIHGTYWIESPVPVETVVKSREVDVAVADVPPGNLQDDLAGKKVTIHFRGEKLPPVIGMVVKFKAAKAEDGRQQPSRFLIVETAKGRSYVESSEIASVEAEAGDGNVKRRRPQLLLTLGRCYQCRSSVRRQKQRWWMVRTRAAAETVVGDSRARTVRNRADIVSARETVAAAVAAHTARQRVRQRR